MGLWLVARCSGGHHCHHMQSTIKMDAAWSHQHNGFHVCWRYGGGGRDGRWDQRRSLHIISFVSALVSAGISTLWVYSTCCHAGKITAHLNAKLIPQKLRMLPPHRQRGEVLGFQPARQPGQKRETLFTAAGLLCLYDGEEREGDTSGAVHLQDRWCCITYVHDCVQPLVLCCFLICSSSQDKKNIFI